MLATFSRKSAAVPWCCTVVLRCEDTSRGYAHGRASKCVECALAPGPDQSAAGSAVCFLTRQPTVSRRDR